MKTTGKYEFPIYEDNDIVELDKYTEVLTDKLEKAIKKQDTRVEEQIKNMTLKDPSSAEIVDARGKYNILGERLNVSDEKIDEQGLIIDRLKKEKIYHFENVEKMKKCLTLVPR